MFVNKSNYDDIVKYYLKTFVQFKEEGEKIFFIKQVSHNEIICEDSKKEEVAICLETGYTIDYVIPKKTVYQYGEHALFLSRIPARMWRKGMDQKNTSFSLLHESGLWVNCPFSIATIEGFVNKPSYFTFQEALNNFSKGEHLQSAALTPRISMSRKGGVFIDTVLVGKYDFTKDLLSYKKIFKPELAKAIPDVKRREL